ncbi:MAG: HlyD family secretion protein [Gammaproteobacteria bacterium]|nr:HlyD family secretion protein [Gammaproteobacteria bacterium]
MTDQPVRAALATDRRTQRAARITVAAVVVALGGLAWWYETTRPIVTTNDAYVEGNIVPVDDQTSGTIRQVLVRNTEFVHAGQVMAVVQADRAQLRLLHAEAHLGAVVRRVRHAFAEVNRLHAERIADLAILYKDEADLARYEKALPSGAIAPIRVEDARAAVREAAARVAAAVAALKAARALVAHTTLATNPRVREAAATVELADILWARRIIRAPLSGYVASRRAYPDAMVHPGERLFSVIPLHELWVVANIKETEMAHVRPGEPVHLISDYWGGRVTYQGRVLGLMPGAGSAFSVLPPDNATGNYIHIVERVPVRIALPDQALRRHPLRPGLSMTVRIDLRSRGNSVLHPLTRTPRRDDRTHIARGERRAARALAASLIAANS